MPPVHRLLSSASCLAAVMVCLVVLSGVGSLAAETFLFDFGIATTPTDSPDESGMHWNNVTGVGTSDTGQLLNLVTTDNTSTPAGLVMIRRFNGANESGTTASTLYPANATRDSLFGNTEVFNGITNIFPGFKLVGLEPQLVYKFTFYASRGGVGDNRETGYTVVGTNTGVAALNVANNIDETVAVSGITPTAGGEITISLAPTANNTNANHFTYLGVLRIDVDATPPPEAVVIIDEPADQSVIEMRPVTFTASVQGSPPFTVQWRKDNVPIPLATALTYTIPAATLDLDGKAFSVVVSNPTSSDTSRNAILHVTADTVAPTIASTALRDTATFELVFSEVLNPLQAGSPASYAASTSGGPVAVSTAEVQGDGRTVVLTLEHGVAGTLTINISQVRDLAGNLVPAGSKAVIQVASPEANTFLFDFGGGTTTTTGAVPNDPINAWNNISGVGATDAGVLADLVTAEGMSTTATLTMVSRFNGANENGTQDPAPFPANATRDSLFGNTEDFNGLSNLTPTFKLTGLDTGMAFDFTFYASRMGVGDNRETAYTATGATASTATLNVANNITETAVITGIVPDELGEISISLAPTENNTDANHFVYLGVLKVKFGPLPPPPVLEILTPTLANGKITVTWVGTGQLEWSPTLKAPWTPITPAPSSPYSEDVLPGQSRFFRVRRP